MPGDSYACAQLLLLLLLAPAQSTVASRNLQQQQTSCRMSTLAAFFNVKMARAGAFVLAGQRCRDRDRGPGSEALHACSGAVRCHQQGGYGQQQQLATEDFGYYISSAHIFQTPPASQHHQRQPGLSSWGGVFSPSISCSIDSTQQHRTDTQRCELAASTHRQHPQHVETGAARITNQQ